MSDSYQHVKVPLLWTNVPSHKDLRLIHEDFKMIFFYVGGGTGMAFMVAIIPIFTQTMYNN